MGKIQPRKRATQARSRATVEAILEATTRILVEENLDAVTTNAVAARAGISIGSLYQYFPGRDAILAELLRLKLSTLLSGLEEAASRSTFEEALRDMLGALARSYFEQPAIVIAMYHIESLVAGDREIAQMRASLGGMVAGVLKQQGLPNLEVVTRDIIAMTRGMAIGAVLGGETDEHAVVERMYCAVSGYLDRSLKAA